MKKRPSLIVSILFFSTSALAQNHRPPGPVEFLHPYQRIAPQQVKSFFEMMNEDQYQEEQQMEEDPELRLFEDQRIRKSKSMKDR